VRRSHSCSLARSESSFFFRKIVGRIACKQIMYQPGTQIRSVGVSVFRQYVTRVFVPSQEADMAWGTWIRTRCPRLSRSESPDEYT